jgi:Uma2 family endonuclease
MATTLSTSRDMMTFAQFEQMPDDGRRYELRNGEPIELPSPIYKHHKMQRLIRRALEAAAASAGEVDTEFGFRPTQEYQFRVADVAFITRERERAVNLDGYFMGAPELVVEVLSPSSRHGKIGETQKLCFENGCLEFWVVDPKRRLVKVSTPDGRTETYQAGQQIPLLFGGELAVAAIFE